MVYGVFGGEYSDWYVIGYFDNRDDADKYCCVCGGDYYVKTLQDLSSERDLSHVELKYTFEIQFVHDTNKNIWVMCDDINDY